MRILLIEKSPTTRRMITNALQRADIQNIRAVTSAEEAFEVINEERVAVFIVGADLDGMSGPAFTTRIRKTQAHEKTAVLMISERATPEDVLAAVDAGVNTYILMPFREEQLVTKVQDALASVRRRWSRNVHYLPAKRLIRGAGT